MAETDGRTGEASKKIICAALSLCFGPNAEADDPTTTMPPSDQDSTWDSTEGAACDDLQRWGGGLLRPLENRSHRDPYQPLSLQLGARTSANVLLEDRWNTDGKWSTVWREAGGKRACGALAGSKRAAAVQRMRGLGRVRRCTLYVAMYRAMSRRARPDATSCGVQEETCTGVRQMSGS